MKYKIYKNSCNQHIYYLLRDRAKVLESKCYADYMNNVENSILRNSKYFWSYIKSKSKSNCMPNVLKYNNSTVSTGEEICNTFSSYFSSMFISDDCSNTSHLSPTKDVHAVNSHIADISRIYVNTHLVAKHLASLDASKSAGPDHVSPVFLINCAKTIALPISLLFEKSLAECIFPAVWKSAYITPIHKKGSKTDITNYRPISKLCVIAKTFERIVHEQVSAILKNQFHSSQHGFRRGRSTVSNLMLLNEHITAATDTGSQVDVIYTDYTKAFDRIDHSTLLFKLARMCIRGNLYRWFSSYIDRRTQAVVVNNYISSWVTISSGVPQGSLLGPLLFTIFIDDISTCFQNSQYLCFADDMKIFKEIKCPDDVTKLQSDLIRLDNYCALNKLDLNTSKCSVISYSRKKNDIKFDYILKNEILTRDDVIRDLGVIYDSKFIFNYHIDNICMKASKSLGFLMRSSMSFTKAKTIKIIYCMLVRSILEYASQIWNPCYDKYVLRIEQIQNKFIKFLCFTQKIKYKSSDYLILCKKFHLLPLSFRREIADITSLLSIANNTIDCPELLVNLKFNVPNRFVRFNPPIHIPLVNTNYRQNSFFWRASNAFNKLSKETDLELDIFCTSVTSARQQLSKRFFNQTN